MTKCFHPPYMQKTVKTVLVNHRNSS